MIKPSPVRILAYLNVSFAGIFGFSQAIMVGESGDLRLMAPLDAVEVAEANRDTIAGIKVRVGMNASGDPGSCRCRSRRQVAERIGLPMMVHIDVPPPTLEDVLALHAAGRRPHPLLPPLPQCARHRRRQGLPAVQEARERGVLFDIGHGMGSFSFKTARTMLANGFLPDTISSDVHALCIDGPAFDLLTTMSKFLCLGVPLQEVIKGATQNAASALQRTDLGTFKPGSSATPRSCRWTAARMTSWIPPASICAASSGSTPRAS